MQLSPQQASELLNLARDVIRSVLSKTQAAVNAPQDPALHQPAGAFVSLHALATHRLRGCVGRLDASHPMYQAVAHAAQSVLTDPRFGDNRVRLDELPSLEIEISLLSPLQPAQNATDFDLLNDGIYLTVGDRSGCFLPQVARETKMEQGATPGSPRHRKTRIARKGVDAAGRQASKIQHPSHRARAL